MSDFKYPGYTPMTDDEKRNLFRNWFKSQYGYEPQQIAGFEWESELERAVLSRLKPDAEPAVKDSLTTDTAERMEALDKLTKMAQEDGLYDDPPVARKETAERDSTKRVDLKNL